MSEMPSRPVQTRGHCPYCAGPVTVQGPKVRPHGHRVIARPYSIQQLHIGFCPGTGRPPVELPAGAALALIHAEAARTEATRAANSAHTLDRVAEDDLKFEAAAAEHAARFKEARAWLYGHARVKARAAHLDVLRHDAEVYAADRTRTLEGLTPAYLWERGGSIPHHLDREVPWGVLQGDRQREWMAARAVELRERAQALEAHADALAALVPPGFAKAEPPKAPGRRGRPPGSGLGNRNRSARAEERARDAALARIKARREARGG